MGEAKESYPAWIEQLFRSGVGLACFDGEYSVFRQALAKQNIQLLIDGELEGAQALRGASLVELRGIDAHKVERALIYLMVVGQAADVHAIETLLDHPNETIRKAAKTCCFELQSRAT
jgi:hypothetical protein